MYSLANSLSSWSRLLNRARSKITLRRTLKWASNFSMTFEYFFLSSSPILVEVGHRHLDRDSREVYWLFSRRSPCLTWRPSGTAQNGASIWAGLLKSNCSGVATGIGFAILRSRHCHHVNVDSLYYRQLMIELKRIQRKTGRTANTKVHTP